MHTWVKIITDYDENVEVEDIEDEFTLIVDTESSKGNNLLTWQNWPSASSIICHFKC